MKKNILMLSTPDVPLDALLKALHTDADDEMFGRISEMRAEAIILAKPLALYAAFTPEFKGGMVYINGVGFAEPFVFEMLSGCGTVVPYVASCGREAEEWSHSFTDVYEQFVADAIKQLCLFAVREKMVAEIKGKYFEAENPVSTINPGSLKDWPVTGQIPLFNALGGVTDDIGVVLSDSFLMFPVKSVSGIMFQKAEAFENCQLCPRLDCPGRRAPYAGC